MFKGISQAQLFLASRAPFELYVWGAIAIPYYVSIGIELEKAVFITAFYLYSVMLLELPTGFIGDRYGHKFSVITGHLLMIIVFIQLLFIDSYHGLLSLAALRAVAETLINGSDLGVLKNISKDLKKDIKSEKYIKSIFNFIGFGMIALVPSLGFGFFLYLTIAFNIICIALLALVDYKHDQSLVSKKLTRQFTDIKLSIKDIIMKYSGSIFLLSIVIFPAVGSSAKTIFSGFQEYIGFSFIALSVINSLFAFMKILGVYFEKYFNMQIKFISVISGSLFVLSSIVEFNLYTGVAIYSLLTLLNGVISIKSKTFIAKHVDQNVIASVFSITTLIRKGFTGVLISSLGYFLSDGMLRYYFIIFGLLFIFTIIVIDLFQQRFIDNEKLV